MNTNDIGLFAAQQIIRGVAPGKGAMTSALSGPWACIYDGGDARLCTAEREERTLA